MPELMAPKRCHSAFKEKPMSPYFALYRKARMTAGLAVLLAALASLLYTANAPPSQQQAKPYDDPEAYRVYSAILPRFISYFDSAETLFIRSKTTSYSSQCLDPNPLQKKLIGSAIADYSRVNRFPWQLKRHFEWKKPYELIPQTGYQARSAEFPGFIELSAVGFNPSKTIAVVYVVSHCFPYCFAGVLVVARKEDEQWRNISDPRLFCGWNR